MTTDHDTYQLWPLVVIIIDGYDPQVAQAVLDAIADVDESTLSALWACHAYAAEQDVERRRN